MSTTKIKRMISLCESREDLKEIIVAARQQAVRLDKLETIAREEAWHSVSKATKGQVAMVMDGGLIQVEVAEPGQKRAQRKAVNIPAGTPLLVRSVQPRAKRLWLDGDQGHVYSMTPVSIERINVKIYPDEMTAHIALSQHLKTKKQKDR